MKLCVMTRICGQSYFRQGQLTTESELSYEEILLIIISEKIKKTKFILYYIQLILFYLIVNAIKIDFFKSY